MTVIEKETLEEINLLRNNLTATISEAGQLSLQIKVLESDIELLKLKFEEQTNKFKQLLEQEQTLMKRLSEKYGVGTIDFETGEFTSEEK